MDYQTFSDLMSGFKDLSNDIPASDPRSAPLVEFYKLGINQ